MSVGVPLLDAVLASRLGTSASYSVVDRTTDNDMGFAIAVAEQLAGSSHRVVWVENGPGAIFVLPQPEPGNVVVSDRAIEHTRRIRDVLLSEAPDHVVAQVAEHTFFTIVAEEALQKGHTDLAVNAIAMSVLSGEPNLTHRADSRAHPGDLGVFTTRCYGLLHELGHLADRDYGHLTTEDNLLRTLGWAFRDWTSEPKLIDDACERAKTLPNSSVIGLGMLRSEVGADLFATESLLEATAVLMDDAGQPFDWQVFIRELHAAQQAVVVFDRLQRSVFLGALPAPTYDGVFERAVEMSLQPLSIAVRNLVQQEFIVSQLLVAIAAAGHTLDRADVDRERGFVQDCMRPLEAHYRVLDAALDHAIDFILNKQRYSDQRVLLENVATALRDASPSVQHLERFLTVAESLGQRSQGTVALEKLITSSKRWSGLSDPRT